MRIGFAAGLIALFSLVATGQETLSPSQREEGMKRMADLQERLKLTPEQKEQVMPVIREEMLQKKAVRDEYGDPRDANVRTKMKMSRKVKSIQSDADKKLAGILDAEQMRELKRFREEVKEEFKEQRK